MTADPSDDRPTVADYDTDARRRLAASVRALVTAVLTSERVADATLSEAAAAIDALVDRVNAEEPNPGVRDRREGTHDAYIPRSPVIGATNPISPPLTFDVVGSRIVGDVTFGPAYEGPPGYVHGGVIALVFDEVLGMVNIHSAHPGMTAWLTVKYRRPTPLFTPVKVEAWTDRVEGRKAIAKGRMTVDVAVTAEVEGLFVAPNMEKVLEYFGPRDETPDPLP
jgi:acyl-coenzyme A thioesterase PaaI-like protein